MFAIELNGCTETALLDVMNCLPGSADEGQVSVLTLLDLSAAFDTLDHSIFLAQLHDMFGIADRLSNYFGRTCLTASRL